MYVPGPANDAQTLGTMEQFWDILSNDQIINIIVECTNSKIEEVCLALVAENRAESYHYLTDADEIRAYIGILFYAGRWKSSNVDNNRLWNKKNSITLYDVLFRGKDSHF